MSTYNRDFLAIIVKKVKIKKKLNHGNKNI